jgi:predicted dehydrogenase
VTVGVIGLGFGRAHIAGFQAAGCQVAAVCQRDPAQARAVAERYGIPRAFERWEQLLDEARPDIVAIAVPPHLHEVIASRAFEAGAHVLCEKPLALDAAQARAMAEAAARHGRVAVTGFNWRFPAAMQRLHALVAGGTLGRVFQVSGRWLAPRWAEEGATPTWRMDRAQAGHGAMGDMGVHLVDLIRWTFGEWTRVAARTGVAYPERTVPGVGVTITVSRAARGVSEHTLEAWGTHGAVRYRLAREGPRWYAGTLALATGSAMLGPVRVAPGLPRSAGQGDQIEVIGRTMVAPMVRRMLAAIRGREPASPSFEDGARAQAVLDAIAESARRDDWVTVAG